MNIRWIPTLGVVFAGACAVFGAAPAQSEPPPKIDRMARAKALRAEAAKLDEQVKPLDALLKPYDSKAAALRDESARWKAQAAACDAEANEIERSGKAIPDPRPKVQQAATNLRSTSSAVRNVRQGLLTVAGNDAAGQIDVISRATGIDFAGLAGAVENAAISTATANTPELLQAEIDRLNDKIIRPLKDASNRAEESRRAHAERYARFDPDVKKKTDEIGYWRGERDKHHANMEEAERRCAASAKNIGMGVIVCTDLQSKAWFFQAQAGAAQADGAIALAQAAIAGIELQRVGDRIGMTVSTALKNTFDGQIATCEQQVVALKDARANLLALRDNAAKQPVAKQKRELAASARAKSVASQSAIADVYQPVADKAKARDELKAQRASLLKKADSFEYGSGGARGSKRFG